MIFRCISVLFKQLCQGEAQKGKRKTKAVEWFAGVCRVKHAVPQLYSETR